MYESGFGIYLENNEIKYTFNNSRLWKQKNYLD